MKGLELSKRPSILTAGFDSDGAGLGDWVFEAAFFSRRPEACVVNAEDVKASEQDGRSFRGGPLG